MTYLHLFEFEADFNVLLVAKMYLPLCQSKIVSKIYFGIFHFDSAMSYSKGSTCKLFADMLKIVSLQP